MDRASPELGLLPLSLSPPPLTTTLLFGWGGGLLPCLLFSLTLDIAGAGNGRRDEQRQHKEGGSGSPLRTTTLAPLVHTL